jgi:hypothetical protein
MFSFTKYLIVLKFCGNVSPPSLSLSQILLQRTFDLLFCGRDGACRKPLLTHPRASRSSVWEHEYERVQNHQERVLVGGFQACWIIAFRMFIVQGIFASLLGKKFFHSPYYAERYPIKRVAKFPFFCRYASGVCSYPHRILLRERVRRTLRASRSHRGWV